MKKVLIISLLLIFIAGCIPQMEEPIKDVVVRVGGELSEKLAGLKGELESNQYLMTPGDRVTVGSKVVEMKDLAYDYKMTFVIGGREYLITETNREEIVEGVVITVKKVNFDPEGEETYAIVEIVKYVPGENEYLMYMEDTQVVDEKEITLYKFESDKSVRIKVEDVDQRVKLGETVTVRDLDITNVKTNLRAITSEKYSVLRIEA